MILVGAAPGLGSPPLAIASLPSVKIGSPRNGPILPLFGIEVGQLGRNREGVRVLNGVWQAGNG
jgi:hypothetical protein